MRGRKGDIVVLEANSWEHIIYRFENYDPQVTIWFKEWRHKRPLSAMLSRVEKFFTRGSNLRRNKSYRI